MRRREFIVLLGGAATWSLAARAQQSIGQAAKIPRLGILMPGPIAHSAAVGGKSRRVVEEAMPSHKFKVGDIVTVRPSISRNAPGGVFEVIKLLPGSSEPEYRIKSSNEPYHRVARESELTKA